MAIPNQFEQKKSKQSLELSNQIQELKKKKNAVILAHYYQDDSIQEIADFLGDSLYLAQQAARVLSLIHI